MGAWVGGWVGGALASLCAALSCRAAHFACRELKGGKCWFYRIRRAANPATVATTPGTTCNYMQGTGGYAVSINSYTWLNPGAVQKAAGDAPTAEGSCAA